MSLDYLEKERSYTSLQTNHRTITSVGVIGLGYVGLPLSILAAERRFRVVGFDIDEKKIAQLMRREAGFLNAEEAVQFKRAGALSVTAEERDLEGLDAYIVCVPTPVHENRLPDLRPLEGACEIVGRHLAYGALVVIESTVSPGVCEAVALPILERVSGLSRDEFHFAHCPERINPGDEKWNVRTIPRVVGGLTEEALERTVFLYSSLIDGEIIRMKGIKEAEAVKMMENAFRDINIAFVNELAISFDRAGIDLVNVIEGASTKPFGFMPFYPGCGVGGHCIPVDPYYLIRYGRENGFEHQFLVTARRINSGMPRYAVRALERTLREKKKKLKGSTVALLGLSYKRDVPDMRESPAVVIKNLLSKAGATVNVYDPYIPGASTASDLEKALTGADAALIATDHSIFKALGPEDFEECGVDIVVDGRNCLDKDAFERKGITYRGIGR
ncbi:nucleotide sugar dehydrogenase [Candidatus Parcubacteria bacterium]|nr:MAG: nucleotide sugar dehydrogenase [Candidatus Parcubacteria bacterium]